MTKQSSTYQKAQLTRKFAEVVKSLHESGQDAVSPEDSAAHIYPYGYGDAAFLDLLHRRFSAREVLEKVYHYQVALICRNYLDDGCPAITDAEQAWKYLPEKTFKPGVLFVFGTPATHILVAEANNIKGKLGDAKNILRTKRTVAGHQEGWLPDELAIGILTEAQQVIEVRTPKLPIVTYVECRKCSATLPVSDAIKEHWWYTKTTKKWTCRKCHSSLMLT